MRRRARTFKDAVLATPAVAGAFRDGLGALTGNHSTLISTAEPRRLTGSINLDDALRVSFPNDSRWDYGIGLQTSPNERALWIEVHSASSGHVSDMIAKLRWLRQWLASYAPELQRISLRFIWIASGRVALSRGSRQARQIAGAGMEFPVRQLSL